MRKRNALKVDFWKTKLMISGCNIDDGLSKSKLFQFGDCNFWVMVNSVLCVQCGRLIHSRCGGVKLLTPTFL